MKCGKYNISNIIKTAKYGAAAKKKSIANTLTHANTFIYAKCLISESHLRPPQRLG